MSHDRKLFEEPLKDLEKLLIIHELLRASGPIHSAYYDALRNRIDRLVILAEITPQHLPVTFPKDFHDLKQLVDLRVLVKGLQREDVTPESLDSIIHRRLADLQAYITSKDFKNLTTDEIEFVTVTVQNLQRGGLAKLEVALAKLNALHTGWAKHLAETSEEELKVSVLFAHDPH